MGRDAWSHTNDNCVVRLMAWAGVARCVNDCGGNRHHVLLSGVFGATGATWHLTTWSSGRKSRCAVFAPLTSGVRLRCKHSTRWRHTTLGFVIYGGGRIRRCCSVAVPGIRCSCVFRMLATTSIGSATTSDTSRNGISSSSVGRFRSLGTIGLRGVWSRNTQVHIWSSFFASSKSAPLRAGMHKGFTASVHAWGQIMAQGILAGGGTRCRRPLRSNGGQRRMRVGCLCLSRAKRNLTIRSTGRSPATRVRAGYLKR
jgi:hypothetical protein